MEVATFGGKETFWRPGACCERLIVKPSGAIVENINIIYVVAEECLGLVRGALENSANVAHCCRRTHPGVRPHGAGYGAAAPAFLVTSNQHVVELHLCIRRDMMCLLWSTATAN